MNFMNEFNVFLSTNKFKINLEVLMREYILIAL